MNKYEQELLSNCSNLDAVTNAGGKITICAQAIIENNKDACKRLCQFLEKSTELKNPQITSIAIAAKDSLIKFFGYTEVVNICSTNANKTEDDLVTLDELMAQLNLLVGLDNVKSKVSDLIAFQNASFIRLRNVTLGYTLPKSVLNKIKLSNIRVYFSGTNLWWLTEVLGYGPGSDASAYPQSRMFQFGLNVSF